MKSFRTFLRWYKKPKTVNIRYENLPSSPKLITIRHIREARTKKG